MHETTLVSFDVEAPPRATAGMLTEEAMAADLEVHPRTLRRWVAERGCPAYRPGGMAIYYDPAEVAAWIRTRPARPAKSAA